MVCTGTTLPLFSCYVISESPAKQEGDSENMATATVMSRTLFWVSFFVLMVVFFGSHGCLVEDFLLLGYDAASAPGALGQHSHFRHCAWHIGSRWYTPDFHIVTTGI
jgi:hypothetical protein